MRGKSLLVATVLAAGTACASGGEAVNPTLTTASRGAEPEPTLLPTSSTTPPPGTAVFTATGLRLVNSEDPDVAFRVLVDSTAPEVSVTLSGVPTPNVVIVVCPAAALDERVPAPGCVTPANGETVRLPHAPSYKGVEIQQLGIVATGPDPQSTSIGQLTLAYGAVATRNVRMRLPPLPPGDAQARPTFRLAPAGSGTYRATVRWTGDEAGGPGTAEAVLAAGAAAVSRAEGGPTLDLAGNVSPAAEATLAVRNTGASSLRGMTIDALFP